MIDRIVCGTQVAEPPNTDADAFPVWDAFAAAGGTWFDTARVYGDGASDRSLGAWLTSRGVRDHVVVVGKGAHTPHCDPPSVTRQLHESLDALRTDHLDVYLLHRDNLEVPVGELVDVCDEHLRAGRFRAWGGSNWTAARIDEANAYAAANGRAPMTYVSNQLSLARMVQRTYPGTETANTPAFLEWLAARDLTLLAWSSQAAGFFAGLPLDGHLAHAWYDDDNLERRRRVERLASKLDVASTTIALAWVLHQPARIRPIIGPRGVEEVASSLAAMGVALSAQQVAWLDLAVP